MPQALVKLFRRFSAPLVFSRLKKEELCLSLAAAHLLKQSHGTFLGPSCVDSGAQQLLAQQMVSKARRVAPLCNAQEISMLATGITALRCDSNDLLDVLIDALYHLTSRTNSNETVESPGSVALLSAVVAVAEAAVQQQYLFSVTLRKLVAGACKRMGPMSGGDRVPLTLVQSLVTVCPYFLSEADLKRFRDEVSKTCASVEGTVIATPLRTAQEAETKGIALEGNGGGDDTIVQWDKEQGGRRVYKLITQVGLGDLPESELAELLELYGHFRLQDRVALELLEARAMESATTKNNASASKIKEIVFKYPHVFKTCVERLAQAHASTTVARSSSEKALVPQSELSALFMDLLNGKRYSNEKVQRLEQTVDVNHVNDVAMYANIVSHPNLNLLAQLQNSSLDALNGKGFCALVRLFVLDVTGAFEKTIQHVIDTVNWNSLFRSFSLEDCLLLADVLATPVSREVRTPKSARLLREEIGLHLQHHLLIQMTSSTHIDFATMCDIAVRCHTLDSNAELLRGVLEYVKTNSNVVLSLSNCGHLLHLLSATGTYDDEVLGGPVEKSVTDAVLRLTSVKSDDDTAAAGAADTTRAAVVVVEGEEELARIMRIQAEYKAPELYGAMELLVRHVETQTINSAHVLVAAGFASLLLENDRVTQRVQDQLTTRLATTQPLSSAELGAICAFLYQTTHISVHLLTRLAERVEQHEGVEAMMSSKKPFNEALVQFAVALLRLHKVGAQVPLLADSVVEYIHTFVQAVSPSVFVELCECVSAAGGDLTAALVEELPSFLDRLSAEQIGRCVYGLSDVTDAGLRLSHQLSMEQVSTYVVDNIALFWDGPVLCQMLRGFARFHCIKRNLYNVGAKQLKKRSVLFTLNRTSIGLALAAFGAVKYVDKELIDHLSRVYVEKADLLSPLDVVESVKALSRMMLLDKPFYIAMGEQLAARAAELPFSAKCDVVQAYGHIGFLHEPMVERLLVSMEDETAQFPSANAAVDMLTSLWCLHHPLAPNKTATATADYIVKHAEELDAAHLVKLCSILVDLDWKHVPLLQAVTTQATHLHTQKALPSHCSRAVLDTLDVFFVYSSSARRVLSESARGYSKHVPLLSDEEAQAVRQLLER